MHNSPSHILTDRAHERLNSNLEAISEEVFRNKGLKARLSSSYVGVDDCGDAIRGRRPRLSSSVLTDPRGHEGSLSASRRCLSAHKNRLGVYGTASASRLETSSQQNLYSPNLFRLGLLGRNPYYIHTDMLALERRRLKVEMIADDLARNLNDDISNLRTSAARLPLDHLVYQPSSNPNQTPLNFDHYSGLSVEIKDVKRQLNDFVDDLKFRERQITDNLIRMTEEEIHRHSPRGSATHRSVSASSNHKERYQHERTTARDTAASSTHQASRSVLNTQPQVFSTKTLPAFTANYQDIGGDPRYYPDAGLDMRKDKFSTEDPESLIDYFPISDLIFASSVSRITPQTHLPTAKVHSKYYANLVPISAIPRADDKFQSAIRSNEWNRKGLER